MRLEDIEKKNIYTVPDKYFDQLPTRIQARVTKKKWGFGFSFNWNLAVKVAAPAFAIILILFYFGIPGSTNSLNAEEILAQVSTEDVIAYLEITDITTDEIIEGLDLSDLELDFENENPLNLELEETDLNALMDEFGLDDEIL